MQEDNSHIKSISTLKTISAEDVSNAEDISNIIQDAIMNAHANASNTASHANPVQLHRLLLSTLETAMS